MTDFEKWVSTQPTTLHDMFCVAAAFQAGQKAEREKYQELIAAAEAIVMTQDIYGGIPTKIVDHLREVLVKMKS